MHHTQTCTQGRICVVIHSTIFIHYIRSPTSHKHEHTHTHSRTQPLTHTHTHKHTCTHAHTHTHTRTHASTHTLRPNKYIYFFIPIYIYI